MTTTTELHAAIAQMQVLMKQAADVIEHNANSLAEAHTRNGIIEDTEVQAAVESDTDLVAQLRAAALPWDQRHKQPVVDCHATGVCVQSGLRADQPAQHKHISYVCPQCYWSLEEQPAQPAKLKVTLEDRPIDIELAQYKRMFEAACSALGQIGDALGCDPEEGGAEPILAAIAELKAEQPAQQPAYEQANPLGGPAKVFQAMADAIRAGDSYHAVLRQYGYAEQPAQKELVAWRELCRRLYIELFHCDQQMMATRDEEGDPMWQQGATVRDVLADAKAALETPPQPAQQQEPDAIVTSLTADPDGVARSGLDRELPLMAGVYLTPQPAQQGQVAITTGMALAFHRALTDGPINDAEAKEIKIGLEAAFAHLTTPQAQPAQQTPAKCWKCGDSDPAYTDVCQVPACGMREGT